MTKKYRRKGLAGGESRRGGFGNRVFIRTEQKDSFGTQVWTRCGLGGWGGKKDHRNHIGRNSRGRQRVLWSEWKSP